MASRKTPVTPGSVVSIDLGDGEVAFARVLLPPLLEFYDVIQSVVHPVDVDSVAASAVLFRVDVMNDAVASRRWPVVGTVPLSSDEIARNEVFFKQDPISGTLSLYWEDRVSKQDFSRPATFDECQRLERAAAWSASHVEDRLRDHFAGNANKWVESLRPRRAGA